MLSFKQYGSFNVKRMFGNQEVERKYILPNTQFQVTYHQIFTFIHIMLTYKKSISFKFVNSHICLHNNIQFLPLTHKNLNFAKFIDSYTDIHRQNSCFHSFMSNS